MKRSQALELEKQGHTVKVYDRRGLVVVDGKDQYKLVEEALEESLDYKMSESDKEVVQAFLDKKPYTGKALETDGTVITSTGYVGGYSSTEPLAKWVAGPGSGERVLVSGEAFGHISQTWINYVRRQVPKKLLFEGRERWKPVEKVTEPTVSEPVRVEEPVVSQKVGRGGSLAQQMANAPKELDNKFVHVRYSERDRDIFAQDKVDRNNEPCVMSRSKRGLEKAWLALVEKFNEETRLGSVSQLLQSQGIRTHYWCAVD
jgi:hypothetical protein